MTSPGHRDPLWNSITHYGTVLGATNTVIALTAVGCVGLLLLRAVLLPPRVPAERPAALTG